MVLDDMGTDPDADHLIGRVFGADRAAAGQPVLETRVEMFPVKHCGEIKMNGKVAGWLAIAAGGLLATVVLFGKYAGAQQTNLGPFETVVSVPNTAVMAGVAANPSRRGLIICNGNGTAANNITVAFGTIVPTDGVGLIIPGGLVAASCWFSGSATAPGAGGMGAQINFIGHVAGPTSVAVFEF